LFPCYHGPIICQCPSLLILHGVAVELSCAPISCCSSSRAPSALLPHARARRHCSPSSSADRAAPCVPDLKFQCARSTTPMARSSLPRLSGVWPCRPRSAQSPSSASALSLLLRACSSVFLAHPAGVFLRAPFSPARISPATVVLSASARDRGRVHQVRQRSVADSTVLAAACLAACSSGVVCCTLALVLAPSSR
jgi:hypothetical protein